MDAFADPTLTFAPPGKQRRKLWEIDSKWHCTILGTCLSIAELRALAAKAHMRFSKADASDYEIHASMVHMASTNRPISKAMHKGLEKKFALAVRQFSKATTRAEVEALWVSAMDRGDITGPLWALMSHPQADDDLQARVFGEMHMLSHQVGSQARIGLRQIHALEKDKSELESRLKALETRLVQENAAHEKTIHALRQSLVREQAENRQLAKACETVEKFPKLQATINSLQEQVELADLRLRLAEQRAETAETQSRKRAEEAQAMQAEIQELRRESQALETRLLETLSVDLGNDCPFDCGRPDLCGRCILYVGGRAAQLPHLRRLVEERNGTLVHHDGGQEESVGRLDSLLGKADAVMFPIDCISHMAHDKLKNLCKRWEKPFVPVRRSGLGAFMQALDAMSRPEPVKDA